MSEPLDTFDVSELVRRLHAGLLAYPEIGGAGAGVERCEPEPEDVPPNGWVGVYMESQDHPIVVAGYGQGGRNHQIGYVICVKACDGTSGAECQDRLELLLKHVRDYVLNGEYQAGLVDFVQDLRIQYARYERTATQFTQTAYLFVTAIKRI